MEFTNLLEGRVARTILDSLLGVAALTGCAQEEIQPGEPAVVVDKEYHPAQNIFVQIGGGGTGMATISEKYHLEVRQCNEVSDTGKAAICVTVHQEVTKELYNSHPVGAEIIIPE